MSRKLIYIGGYGWSGSTLLTRMLMLLPKVQSLGEFHNILEDLNSNSKCSCGKTAQKCRFWSKYYQVQKEGKITAPELLKLIYADHPGTIFIDASKTTYPHNKRATILSEDYDVIFIHLVRDGKNVLASNLRRSKYFKTFKTLTTSVQWYVANKSGDAFKRKKLGKYFLLRYEDMVQHPKALLEELSTIIGVGLEKNINVLDVLPLGHQLSGNAIRTRPKLKIEIYPDPANSTNRRYTIFKMFNYTRLKKYGYF